MTTHLCAASTDPFVNDVHRVDTVANLRLIEAPAVRMAYLVEGGTTAGDGDWRLYYWDEASILADDGLLVIAPSVSGTGRWRLLYSMTVGARESLVIICTDQSTAITAAAPKFTFWMPNYATSLDSIQGYLVTPQVSGSIFTVDINEAGTTILSTKLTIDNGEESSTTAATPLVISDAALAAKAKMTIDVDQIGNGTAKGLVVVLNFHQV